MRKNFLLVLATILIFVFTACAAESPAVDTTSSITPAPMESSVPTPDTSPETEIAAPESEEELLLQAKDAMENLMAAAKNDDYDAFVQCFDDSFDDNLLQAEFTGCKSVINKHYQKAAYGIVTTPEIPDAMVVSLMQYSVLTSDSDDTHSSSNDFRYVLKKDSVGNWLIHNDAQLGIDIFWPKAAEIYNIPNGMTMDDCYVNVAFMPSENYPLEGYSVERTVKSIFPREDGGLDVTLLFLNGISDTCFDLKFNKLELYDANDSPIYIMDSSDESAALVSLDSTFTVPPYGTREYSFTIPAELVQTADPNFSFVRCSADTSNKWQTGSAQSPYTYGTPQDFGYGLVLTEVLNPDIIGDIQSPSAQSVSADNVYYDPNPQLLVNTVNFNPKQVWYDTDGSLIAEMHVTNGFGSTAYNIHDVQLAFYDKDENLIASGAFGAMEGASIGSMASIVWTFKFSPDMVSNQNPDFRTLLTKSSCAYAY